MLPAVNGSGFLEKNRANASHHSPAEPKYGLLPGTAELVLPPAIMALIYKDTATDALFGYVSQMTACVNAKMKQE